MRLRFASLAATSAAALALLAPTRARAYDVLATPCAAAPLTCGIGAIKFDRVDALPIQWSFDTGWVPQGSPLEVHVWADVWANTHVALAGQLETAWPTAMTLQAPGNKEGGDFGFHYGADFGAQGKVTISVLGKSYSWTGDIPYVPQFDLQVKDAKTFDAWGYAPGVGLKGETMPQKIASVSVGSLIGGSIPGIDGGFELDVAMELEASYVTDRIVVATTDGKETAGGPITASDGQSSTPPASGGSLELDVHPEGTVRYDGVIHMIPSFYVSLLGNQWTIPIVDIPIAFPITQNAWIFDKQRVHVPLPDLALSEKVLDFGELTVGEKKTLLYQLWNAGEARAVAAMTTSDAITFPLLDTGAALDPGLTYEAKVEFIPSKGGPFAGQIAVLSNDPKAPVQLVLLKGTAKAAALPPPLPATPEAPAATEKGTCACTTVGAPGGSDGRALGLGMVAAVALLRRRRRS